MYSVTPTYSTFNDVLPGDPWQPEPAERYNAVNDLLRQEGNMISEFSPGIRGDISCVNVLNTSDKIIYFNRGVQIDSDSAGSSEVIDPANVHVCGRPVEDENAFWGVALEEIPPGKAGMVQIAGVTCLRNVWGDREIKDEYSKFICKNNFIVAGKDGIFHVMNRGQARILWHDVDQMRAIVLLNSNRSYYDGMFAVMDNGDRTLTVKGGVTDLLTTRYGNEFAVLEDTVVPVYARIKFTYVCLTGVRKSNGGWSLKVESSIVVNGSDLYIPGERIVWPLARYLDINSFGHVNALQLLHQGGSINFKERYYVE